MTDPVTAARERLERLLPDVLRYDPVSMPAFDQRIDALIEAVRAEAGGVSVEALLDAWEAQEHPSIDAAIQAALAARSAGSGSRVERGEYHPDPDIDAEVRQDALEAERADLAAGYPPRWWVCPSCGASHRRGWFLAEGQHRCLRCGYVGDGGTMHTNRPTPPPAVDGTRVDPRQRTGNIGGPAVADHFARPTPPPAGATQVPLPATDSTPPPAVDGTRCAECGGVKDDVFHVPCLVGGPFHYVKTCHPFTPPTPAPAVDGTRCGFRLGCGGRPDDPQHQRPFSGWGSMTAHDFEPNTPPAPDPDRLRALEAALDHAEKNLGVIALTLTDHPEYPMKAADVDAARSLARFTAQDIRAARDLLADGERSDG